MNGFGGNPRTSMPADRMRGGGGRGPFWIAALVIAAVALLIAWWFGWWPF